MAPQPYAGYSIYSKDGNTILYSGGTAQEELTIGGVLSLSGVVSLGITAISNVIGGEPLPSDAATPSYSDIQEGRASFYDVSPQLEIIESLYNNGQEYKIEAVNGVPEGGTEGQILTKTSSGCGWADASRGGYFADVLVVGGGGGGGSYGGGGGAGGVKLCREFTLFNNSYCVKIGCKGAGGCRDGSLMSSGCNGGDSCFGNKIISGGGGGGGGNGKNGCNSTCGGGGGGGGIGSGVINTGGLSDIGNDGGHICCFGSYSWAAGGGGGSAGPGGIIISGGRYVPASGGPGYCINFDGTCKCYGAGGSGVTYCTAPSYYTCRQGGGSSGACDNNFTGGDGPCCGSGGGGGLYTSGCGGCGIVIVRYPTDGSYGINCATGGTVTTCTIDGTSYKIHTFTSNDTFCIVS